MAGQYQLPPWIENPPPFADSLLRGASVGTGIRRNFLEASRLKQEQQRENALLPLQRAVLDNQVKSQAIGIETSLWKQQDYLANKKAFSELSQASATITAAGGWADPTNERRIWEIASKYPSVVDTPEFGQIAKRFDVAGAAAIRAKEAETRALKVEGDLGLAGQRIELGKEQLAAANQRHSETLASKEKIEFASNEKDKEIATMKLMDEAKDILPEMLKREFSEGIRKLRQVSEDERWPKAKYERESQELFNRFKSRSEELRGAKTNAPDERVRVKGPNGKIGNIPRSQLGAAIERGYTEMK